MDILTTEYAELITAPNTMWEKLLVGGVDPQTGESENAVYGFKGDKTATFDTVRIFIGETTHSNIKTVELLVSADSPTGPFTSAGKVETQNIRMAKTGGWQEFKFTPVTAKYLKCKMTAHDSSWVRISKVGDAGKSLQILGQVNPYPASVAIAKSRPLTSVRHESWSAGTRENLSKRLEPRFSKSTEFARGIQIGDLYLITL